MPANISISESSSIDSMKGVMAEKLLALQHLIDTLPEPYKSHFNSPIKLLIGNKVCLAIIPPNHMWSYLQDLDVIYGMFLDIDYLGYDLDFIMLNFFDPFLSRLSISMAINGAFLNNIFTQTVHQKQELVGLTEKGIQVIQEREATTR